MNRQQRRMQERKERKKTQEKNYELNIDMIQPWSTFIMKTRLPDDILGKMLEITDSIVDDSENAKQNSGLMTRLVLWHFYAISFNLEQAITLETHCEQVEKLLIDPPQDAFGWVKILTELLHTYAKINAEQNPQQDAE